MESSCEVTRVYRHVEEKDEHGVGDNRHVERHMILDPTAGGRWRKVMRTVAVVRPSLTVQCIVIA